ncbi:MAG: hypothetical protein WAU68_17430 [Vitreimonas sp.]
MSVEEIKGRVEAFLQTATPEVLCISGEWGVGKTHTWRALLKESKSTIKLTHYSYVSLFGVNSVDELRHAVFANRIPVAKIGEKLTAQEWEAIGRKHSGLLRDLASVLPWGIGDAAKALAPMLLHSIRDQLVCIDDLERKGRDLSMRDALGLVSFLRYECDCKVVILSNTNAFARKADKKDFDEQLEKVVDNLLVFDPTATYSANVALGEAYPALKERCIALEISNIRVIDRIRRLYDLLAPMLAEFHSDVASRVANDLAVLGWCKFSNNSPDVEFLNNRHDARRAKKQAPELFAADAPEDRSKEGAWNALLDKYGLYTLDDLGLTLWDGVKKGFFDIGQVRERCRGLQKSVEAAEAEQAQREAWQVFHGSFADNEAEVVSAIFDTHYKYVRYCSLGNLDGVVRLLRDLDRSDLADKLLSHYVEENEVKRGAFDLNENRLYAREIIDEKLIATVTEKYATFADARSPIDAMLEVGVRGGNDEDYSIAARVTTDQLVSEFKSRRGEALHDAINACIRSDRVINARDSERQVSSKAKEALLRIGAESRINRLRVRRFVRTADEA